MPRFTNQELGMYGPQATTGEMYGPPAPSGDSLNLWSDEERQKTADFLYAILHAVSGVPGGLISGATGGESIKNSNYDLNRDKVFKKTDIEFMKKMVKAGLLTQAPVPGSISSASKMGVDAIRKFNKLPKTAYSDTVLDVVMGGKNPAPKPRPPHIMEGKIKLKDRQSPEFRAPEMSMKEKMRRAMMQKLIGWQPEDVLAEHRVPVTRKKNMLEKMLDNAMAHMEY